MGLVQVKVTGVGTNPVALHMVPKAMTVTQGQTVEGEMDEANVATLETFAKDAVKVERGARGKERADEVHARNEAAKAERDAAKAAEEEEDDTPATRGGRGGSRR